MSFIVGTTTAVLYLCVIFMSSVKLYVKIYEIKVNSEEQGRILHIHIVEKTLIVLVAELNKIFCGTSMPCDIIQPRTLRLPFCDHSACIFMTWCGVFANIIPQIQ